jgi:protein-disulfide isomerase
MMTRREFVMGVSVLALALAAAEFSSPALSPIGDAQAQTPSAADLLQPGPFDEMALGDEKAPVTIIEYASMTCSHCARFHETTYPELKKRYIDTGKVRFIFREFPLDPLAAAGFMLARCAGKEKYFDIVEMLFQQQQTWAVRNPLPPLLALAKQAGFSEKSFEECLANQPLLDGIEQVRGRAAEKFGVNSTPTFFINGKVQRGALSITELDKLIEPYLKS